MLRWGESVVPGRGARQFAVRPTSFENSLRLFVDAAVDRERRGKPAAACQYAPMISGSWLIGPSLMTNSVG